MNPFGHGKLHGAAQSLQWSCTEVLKFKKVEFDIGTGLNPNTTPGLTMDLAETRELGSTA